METVGVCAKAKKAAAKTHEMYLSACRRIGAFQVAPTDKQLQGILLLVGLGLITIGLAHGVDAQTRTATYNDTRIASAVNVILAHIEGSFGALVMVAAGIGAILSSAFGNYRAALALLVVAVGSFILRSLIGTFFNDTNIMRT